MGSLRRRVRHRRAPRDAGMVPIWSQIAGHAAAFRSDMGVTLNGATVSDWASQGGTLGANSLAQGTADNQPTFSAADANFNGCPSLTFDTNDVLTSGLAASAWRFLHNGTGCTVLIVCRPTANATRSVIKTVTPSGTHGLNGQHIGGSDRFQVLVRSSSSSIISIATGAGAPEDTRYSVLVKYASGTDPDAALYHPVASQIGTANESGSPEVGDSATTLILGENSQISFAEFVVWPFETSAGQDALISAYTIARYGS